MTRSNTPLARSSLLRQLKRVNNKSRFRIFQGDLQTAETLFIDEGKLSWGIDKEDVNEQHLQQILAASQSNAETLSGGQTKNPAAYIPTPDSTGVVADYHERYESHAWQDPVNYTHSSQTPDEYVENGLANGFTYYMDERDKEWLDKNNEQARGEGTSVFGALSSVAASTRSATSPLSARQKGKEADTPQPALMSEDEFELIMGIFEKFTHEKVGSINHSTDKNTAPPFSDFQRTLSFPLDRSLFASLTVPSWVPSPPQVLRIARAIHPWWSERLLERKGQRIIPVVNLNEADTLNESYVCFRKRDVKAARKTRAALSSSCDKLLRLDLELQGVLDTAKAVLAREQCKKGLVNQSKELWEKRMTFLQAKQQCPSANNKADEELLLDRESSSRRRSDGRNAGRGSQHASSLPIAEALVRPRDRLLILQNKTENEIQRKKLQDINWDDQTDNAYQPRPTPYPSRFFRAVPRDALPSSPPWWDEDTYSQERSSRSLRVRVGRGGCIRMDRRSARRGPFSVTSTSDDEDEEERRRMQERWKYDEDDEPMLGVESPEEADRSLVDDFDSKFIVSKMSFLTELDTLVTNNSIPIMHPDGLSRPHTPFKMGRELYLPLQAQRVVRPLPPSSLAQAQPRHPVQSSSSASAVTPATGVARRVSGGAPAGGSGSTQSRVYEGSPLNPAGRGGAAQQVAAPPPQQTQGLPTQSQPAGVPQSAQQDSETQMILDPPQAPVAPTAQPAQDQSTAVPATLPAFKYNIGTGNAYPPPGQTLTSHLTSQQWQHIQATLASLATKDNAIKRYLQSGNDQNGLSAAVQLLNSGQNKPLNLKLPLPRQQQGQRPAGAAVSVNGKVLTSPQPASTPLPRRGSSVDDPSHH